MRNVVKNNKGISGELFERDNAMAANKDDKGKGKKNLYPKIVQLVKISQYTVGDNPSVKYKGFHITPAQAKQLAYWHEQKIEVKLTLQQNEGELFKNGDNGDEEQQLIDGMSPKKKKDTEEKTE